MLSTLHIENIAVIEAVDIDFAPGFNVLTGETGAGKSIVIDAISAILGERTYRDVIRTGASKAFVSAVFSDVPRLDWFEENHVPYDPELLVQRELSVDGRNVCRVNGQPVSVSLLHALGMQLINIHGQHDSQQLFDEENHLRYLDLFARNEREMDAYRSAYADLTTVRREIERLSIDEGEKLRRTEMLRHQIGEIDRANLKSGEDETLEARRKLLQNAEKFSQSLLNALRCLYGDEDTDGASGYPRRNTPFAASRASIPASSASMPGSPSWEKPPRHCARSCWSSRTRPPSRPRSWTSWRAGWTPSTACAANTARPATIFLLSGSGRRRSWTRSSSPTTAFWSCTALSRSSRKRHRMQPCCCAKAARLPRRASGTGY